MSRAERTVGIVLSSSTVGEYDKRVVLLTREYGRISAFARGARRPKSPLSAVTEPFCFGEYYIYRGRDSYQVEEVRVDNYFPELRKDLDKLSMGMYFCEVADYFTREGMGAGEELELLYRSLLALERASVPIRLLRRIYELRMLMVSGYAPLYIEERHCWHDGERDWQLSAPAGYCIGQILSRPMKELYSFTVSEPVLAEVERCVDSFFKQNTDKKFHSLQAFP